MNIGQPTGKASLFAAGKWPDEDMMDWMTWYNELAKPGWTPSPSRIGLIWQILYPILIVSFGFVFVEAMRGQIPWRVAAPFAINLVANLIFTPIQFGLRNLPLATVDILIVWSTILWLMIAIWPRYRWVAAAQLPYFVWVSTATVLQLSITWLNRPWF
jgi:benzodiazapine receptor